jgi:arylsulfatase A-like enzyme
MKQTISRREFIRMGLAGLLSISLTSCLTGGEESLPNIVIIFADDIGPGDIAFYHRERVGAPPVVPTPNIDWLISAGMRFNHAYAPNSLCAPSRFSMLTGNYSYRNERPFGAWKPWTPSGIEPEYTTFARIAKQTDYATAFLGKWGCGGELHEKDGGEIARINDLENTDFSQLYKAANYFGFDYALELPAGIQNSPLAFYENSQWMPLQDDSTLDWLGFEQHQISKDTEDFIGFGDSNWDPSLVGPLLATKATAYIAEHTRNSPDQPFLMFYASQAVHEPHTPSESLQGTPIAGSTPGALGDMIVELDTQIGMIIDSLKACGVWDNTLFIFTSDNGGLPHIDQGLQEAGHDSTNGLRGRKGNIYEGGSRVPFIAVWPNQIKPGSESNERIVGHDVVATIQALTGQRINDDVVKDSLNLLPLFQGDPQAGGHAIIIQQSPRDPFFAIIKEQWKLILSAEDKQAWWSSFPVALFDLTNNPGENEDYNLIDDVQYQEIVERLLTEYHSLRETGRATVQH